MKKDGNKELVFDNCFDEKSRAINVKELNVCVTQNFQNEGEYVS